MKDHHCPNCGFQMEQIFCKCEVASSYKLYRVGARTQCGICGFFLSPEAQKTIEKAFNKEEINE